LFEQDDVDEDETEQERRERIAEERAAKKWSWFSFFYGLAQGDITKMESVLKLNILFTLTFKSFEIENKKIREYYDWRRYNLTAVTK
jgi:hypothetical protein